MPTQLRGQGTALVNVMSMVSQMASPYIVYSVRFFAVMSLEREQFIYQKAVLSEKAPFLIVSILSVLGAFPGLFLPETADVNLPDSLEEIEDFGRSAFK